MRLFLAIDLPPSVKKQLDRELMEIRQRYADFNWVTADNFHITLHFYGETKKLDKIKEKLKNIFFDQESFYLYSTDIDLFINQKIIIYLNFRREKKLEELGEKVKEAFPQDFYNRKRFVPHLTLARCRIPSKQQYFTIKKRLKKLTINFSFPVKKLTLFESILGGKRPTYKKIAEFPLF